MTVYVDKPDATMARIASWIGYTGKKYRIEVAETIRYASYWDGGSRDEYFVTKLETMETAVLPSNHPAFDPKTPDVLPILPGLIVTVHSIFCGKDHGLTFHVNPATVTALSLPAQSDTPEHERIVLAATAGLKNTYGGETNIRFREAHRSTGISAEAWEAARISCISKGYLNKAGAITPAGRNAVGDYRLR